MKLISILLLGLVTKAYSAARSVTHEDIRDAMINMIHIIRDSNDKLERHESRERQLAEHLKKALSGLDMRERAQDNLLRSTVKILNGMDERLKKIEAKTEEQDSRSVQTIDPEPLQRLTAQIETLINKQANEESESVHYMIKSLDTSFSTKNNYIVDLVEKLQQEMDISAERLNALVVHQREKSLREESSESDRKWQNDVSKILEEHTRFLEELQRKPQSVVQQDNMTLDEVLSMRNEILQKMNDGTIKTENKLQEIVYAVNDYERNVLNSIKDSKEDINQVSKLLQKKAEDLMKELAAVQKIEQILLQTSDNVMDTKRRVEYGLHQILQEVGDVVKTQGNELNDTVNNKFTGMTDSIYTFQTGAVGNISTKVETEIGQVWRQIGIMHQQITTSAAVLDKLQNETESYITESDNKLDAMATKLDNIGSDLLQIQDNHNFLIGRLSLFTHEFNETRIALADASKYLREAYESSKNKSQNNGPGPAYSTIDGESTNDKFVMDINRFT